MWLKNGNKTGIERRMSRAKTTWVAAAMALAVLVFGGLPLMKGAFYLGKHEGDAMHLADLVLRMADGQ